MLYNQLLVQQKQLDAHIKDLESQLMNCPEGKIFCTYNNGRYKWYHSHEHSQTYIPKKNRSFAEQLAIKKYLSLQYEEALQEKAALDKYLKHLSMYTPRSQELLKDSSPYCELLTPYFHPLSQELSTWTNDSFECNPRFPEQLIYKSGSGHIVRSKSEVLIDMALFTNKIPYRYECALHLGDVTIYPDFTIRHPQTGSIYYWEHFGLMDDSSYCKNVISKLQLYTSHGIIPTIQLITTYETKAHPLNPDTIDNIIKSMFLT